MKRLIFCFDGTWNKLAPDRATNVVLTAASIERLGHDGVPQIIHYDEGVGTGQMDQVRGGVFGTGLMDNVREAYRFLVFNYDVGDEIHVFGFSRGAYSARTFVGFLRHVGPLQRLHVGRIDEALHLYEKRTKGDEGASEDLRRFRSRYSASVCIGGADDEWRCLNVDDYVTGAAPPMRIRYLGVWDTVGALGIPERLPLSGWFNRKYHFHDIGVDDFVESARHAVAIDERRVLFPVATLGDLTPLNAAAGFADDHEDAPFQERWFPGTHGSVGGGGDVQGLSDEALLWILAGAKHAGLRLDTAHGTRLHGLRPDPLAPLVNETKPERSATAAWTTDRAGPDHLWQVSESARRRWRTPAAKLGGKAYRPATLSKVAAALEALGKWEFTPPTDLIAVEIVKPGDFLGRYAQRHYGDGELWRPIHAANLDTISDPNEIVPGREVRIPRLDPMPASAPVMVARAPGEGGP